MRGVAHYPPGNLETASQAINVPTVRARNGRRVPVVVARCNGATLTAMRSDAYCCGSRLHRCLRGCPRSGRADGQHSVLEAVCHEPPVHGIGGDEPNEQRHRHHKPECGCVRAGRRREHHSQDHHRGNHTSHEEIHRKQFGDERATECAFVRSPRHVAHEQCLENRPAERKAQHVF